MNRSRLLFLDAYDSFSNNIIALVELALKTVDVSVIRIDDPRFYGQSDGVFHDFLRGFDAVIAGPGPGDPRNVNDLGLINKLWSLPEDCTLPTLGVCLGFQSLVIASGGSVERLTEPRHGLVTEVSHQQRSLFCNVNEVHATQYHSLRASLSPIGQSEPVDLWAPAGHSGSLVPIAWDLSDTDNGPILMAVMHTDKPFWGVQYHPESICTNEDGARIIHNWWREAQVWIRNRAQVAGLRSRTRYPLSTFVTGTDSGYGTGVSSPTSSENGEPDFPAAQGPDAADYSQLNTRKVSWLSIDTSAQILDVANIIQIIRQSQGGEPLLLESGVKDGKPVRAETGRYTIIGCRDTGTDTVRYSTVDHAIDVEVNGRCNSSPGTISDALDVVRCMQNDMRAIEGPHDIPFWGGLIGYVGYEAGLETINVVPPNGKNHYPDLWFVKVSRCIVIDHVEGRIYVQSLRFEDEPWLSDTRSILEKHINVTQPRSTTEGTAGGTTRNQYGGHHKQTYRPIQDEYELKVQQCQSHIRAGSSYELCLTDQTRIHFDPTNSPQPWELYKRLRHNNPAPFGAYLHLTSPASPPLSILSSSPERFLSWTRDGKCQFRPIKGTVQKSATTTLDSATAILRSKKEQAENLMIVDLIRHDLHGVVGSGNVSVTKLMQVEEYETVYQLVSVIEGQLPAAKEVRKTRRATGMDLLAASLPPGSMTGAPKKRSCELLTDIEGGRPRGIYAGVLGYLDAGGGGDFSVVIRTLVGWRGEWSIGAGGAVTALSSPQGEWEEMMGKSMAAQKSVRVDH